MDHYPTDIGSFTSGWTWKRPALVERENKTKYAQVETFNAVVEKSVSNVSDHVTGCEFLATVKKTDSWILALS